MNKNLKVLLALGVIAGLAYVLYRWYEARVSASGTGQASGGGILGGTGSLGTNLNSVAPELIGGSEAGGTKVAPAVDVPVNITMSSSSTIPAQTGLPDSSMQPLNNTTASPLGYQNTAAGAAADQGTTASDVNGNGDMDDVGVQSPDTSGTGANPTNSSSDMTGVAVTGKVDPHKVHVTKRKKK